MKRVKYKGECYLADSPRHIGEGKYTCAAMKERTGHIVRDAKILNGIGGILARKERGREQ